MPEIVADCPRCDAKSHTFVVLHGVYEGVKLWQRHYELFAVCKNCDQATILKVRQTTKNVDNYLNSVMNLLDCPYSLNRMLTVHGYLTLRNMNSQEPPKHTPEDVGKIFKEGSESVQGQCPNAAGAMFRTTIDVVTKGLLPTEGDLIPNNNAKNNLAARLEWLFENEILANNLQELSENIRLDGNDGAHDASLTMDDALDMMEFTNILLQRIYTEPAQIIEARERREARRS